MARDMIDEALSWPRRLWERVKAIRSPLAATAERRGLGLSAKLLLLTSMFVMLAEVLIFVPSVANFRVNWLKDRLASAYTAALVLDAAPNGVVSDALAKQILNSIGARAVAMKMGTRRRMLAIDDMPPPISDDFDMRDVREFDSIVDAFKMLLNIHTKNDVMRVEAYAAEVRQSISPDIPRHDRNSHPTSRGTLRASAAVPRIAASRGHRPGRAGRWGRRARRRRRLPTTRHQ